MLNQKFYETALALQSLGYEARYDEEHEQYGQLHLVERRFFIQIVGLPVIKVLLKNDSETWPAKKGKIKAILVCSLIGLEGREIYLADQADPIYFAETKTAQQMANDINRRLLTPNLETIKKEQDGFYKNQAMVSNRFEVLKAVAETAQDPKRSLKPDQTKIEFFGFTKPTPGLRSVDIGYTGEKLRLELEDITFEQFQRVCEALRG